jgi:hypothetical protein
MKHEPESDAIVLWLMQHVELGAFIRVVLADRIRANLDRAHAQGARETEWSEGNDIY